MAHNTDNPSGSEDPRDLIDNGGDIDIWATGEMPSHPNRLGIPRKTFKGMNDEFEGDQAARELAFDAEQTDKLARFNALMASASYVGTGNDGAYEEYAPGITITEYNQLIRYDGMGWKLSFGVELPYTTIGTVTPEAEGFVSVADAVLRQQLASEDEGTRLVQHIGETLFDAIRGLKRISANKYGAAPDADWTINRTAIQNANDAAASYGGAVVTMDPGVYEVKGVIQDSGVIFDIPGVTLKSPDGFAPDVITTRLTTITGSATKASRVIDITAGSTAGIKVGTRVAVFAAGGLLDSQQTNLTAGIDASTTTIALANVTGLANSGTLLIDDELISFTGRSGGTLTGVTRAAFGTTAALHTTAALISIARRLYATVYGVSESSLTLDRPALASCVGVQVTYGVINSGISGLPTIDGNKPELGAPASTFACQVRLGSWGVYHLRVINGETGGLMFSRGSAYNYCRPVHLHDCGVPAASKGSALWLYQGCEHNHFNVIGVTGKAWVAVYSDDRTSVNEEGWDGPCIGNNCPNTIINVTESSTAVLNIVSGQYNKFLGGSIIAPRVGINCSDNSQGTGGGAKSIGNIFGNFDIDVDEYPYLIYSTGNILYNIFVKRGRLPPILAPGNTVYAISPALGAPPIMPKGYRKNSLPKTKFDDFAGWDIPASNGTGSAGGVIDLSDSVATFNPIVYNLSPAPAAPGQTWTGAIDVTVPDGYPSIQLRCAIVAYKNIAISPEFLGSSTSATVTINPGETKRLGHFLPLTPTLTEGVRLQIQMMSTAASGRRIVLNPSPVLEDNAISVASLFDGDTAGGLWTGTPEDSPSLLF